VTAATESTGTSPPDSLDASLLVGDAWLTAATGGSMPHVNPATGQVQAAVPLAGVAEIDGAVAAAVAAGPAYRSWTGGQRRDVMLRIAGLLRRDAAQLARLTTLESGMPLNQSAAIAERAASWFDYYAGWTDKLTGRTYGDTNFVYTRLEPFGTIAVLLTWNGAIGSIGMKVAPALAAGCTVVLKPPELAPFTSTHFGRLCAEAGLPPGVLNVVPGGPDAASALVRDARVDKISFTGGPATARLVQAAAAESLTPLILELGGKSVSVVFPDADLPRAARVSAQAITRMAGQVCHAPTRLLVHDAVYDEVIRSLHESLSAVRLGDPFDRSLDMGPVISRAACERILGVIESAAADGTGTLITGGNREGGELADGYFIRPTVFGDVDPLSPLAQQEVFGPVLSVMRFADEDEAAELANNTPYGLAAYVQTADVARAHRFAARLTAGNIGINGGGANNGPVAPFGGYKDSGYGREGGLAGIEEYVRSKTVSLSLI
jgi:aldehyde dehydrogenase (NAD+)